MAEHPQHMDNLFANLSEVMRLVEIHGEIAGSGPGYKHNVQVLNKSAVVLLVATWEAFVEDVATTGAEFMLKNADNPSIIPKRVLVRASKQLTDSNDNSRIWELAGEGWKRVLQAHKKSVLEKYVGRLNTPRPAQIDYLFENLIGFKDLSSRWYWSGLSNKRAKAKLESLITLRGSIAHRVEATRSVTKHYVETHREFVMRLAAITSNRVRDHLESMTGKKPWQDYRMKQTS